MLKLVLPLQDVDLSQIWPDLKEMKKAAFPTHRLVSTNPYIPATGEEAVVVHREVVISSV